MRRLSGPEVQAQKVAELGLDPAALDMMSVEAIAGALRRAAGFLCPCTAATLVRNVVAPLRGLVNDINEVKEQIDETLEAMVAHGDLCELRKCDEATGLMSPALLYATPPAFVVRESGMALLLGISSDQLSPLPDDLEARIEYIAYVRKLVPLANEDLAADLQQLGLVELTYDAWLHYSEDQTAAQFKSEIDRVLEAQTPSREIPGLVILDSTRPTRYYRGRWTEPKSHTGRFVARRSQAYGADLWCYVQLKDGQPEIMLDLPSKPSRWRGCDEAWHLQLAIDAIRGEPQRYRLLTGPAGSRVLQLFSPVPMWARRRWNAIGEPVPITGCLFAYRISEEEFAQEVKFARDTLWLEEVVAT
ncbi:hypothetical protein [Bythopirellula goksoeyrii]|nr:hypothetical protein [Bythopirellula goksoeyrii]